ncbi:MAG: hypothetical protein ACYDA5_08005 [Vulcanimicrobiaceae bacterium]
MIRYYLIATVIVLTVAVLATAWANRALIQIKIASVNVRVPPKPAPPLQVKAAARPPFIGTAPWALSALPECFQQVLQAKGSPSFVAKHIPRGARLVRAGTTIVQNDCVVRIGRNQAFVTRGPDRFRIPPRARFYRSGRQLVLVRAAGGHVTLRTYVPTRSPGKP